MAFDDWFGEDEDDFLRQLGEIQKRVSRLMRNQLKEIIAALKGGELEGEMHIKPIDGPGVRGYILWGQLDDSSEASEKEAKIPKPIVAHGSRKAKSRGSMSVDRSDVETTGLRVPLMDKFKSGNEYVILAELPGVEESDISMDAREGVLVIRGGESFKPTRIRLPPGIDTDRIKKTYKNGILEIRIPRSQKE